MRRVRRLPHGASMTGAGPGPEPVRGPGSRSGAGEIHHPVGFPGLAVVDGKGLLPPWRGGGNPRPEEPDEHRPSAEGVRAVEGSGIAGERTGHRRLEDAWMAGARPVDRPLTGAGVEQAQRHAGEAAGVPGAELVDVAQAVEDGTGLAGGVELVPVLAAGEPLAAPPVADLPPAHEEVEVPSAVRQGGRGYRLA